MRTESIPHSTLHTLSLFISTTIISNIPYMVTFLICKNTLIWLAMYCGVSIPWLWISLLWICVSDISSCIKLRETYFCNVTCGHRVNRMQWCRRGEAGGAVPPHFWKWGGALPGPHFLDTLMKEKVSAFSMSATNAEQLNQNFCLRSHQKLSQSTKKAKKNF